MTCQGPGCSNPLPPRRRRFCSDLCRIRGHRAERTYESGEYARGALTMLRTAAKRAGSDPAEFRGLWELRAEADEATTAALDGLRAKGYTWAQLAALLHITRQALQQWRSRRPEGPGSNTPLTPERTSANG